MNTENTSSSPRISITPDNALSDEKVAVALSGFPSHVHITLQAQTHDDERKEWASQATFLTDADGNVDPSVQSPLVGSYHHTDGMGLFWSMTTPPVKRGKRSPAFVKTDVIVPTTITFVAKVGEESLTMTQAQRFHIAAGVTEVLVQEHGLVGKLFLPAGPGPHPGLLVLSGSDGTIREQGAALLASHGYAAFALVYFGANGLPKQLARISLEYFEQGIEWFQQQKEIAEDRIGVIGSSKGGELALLLGATFPQIKTVIASAPSSLIHGGVGTAPSVPGWTYHQKPLPHSAYKPTVSELLGLLSAVIWKTPFVGRPLYLKELSDKKAIDRASIPVEKIQGPILLISGEEDALWPSTIYAEMIMERLARHSHPYPDENLRYKGLGHLTGVPYSFPYLPPTLALPPQGMVDLAFGGNIEDSAQAVADSWVQTLAFLNEHL